MFFLLGRVYGSPLSSAASGPHDTPPTISAGWSILAVHRETSALSLQSDA